MICFIQDHKKDLEILKSAILDNEIMYFSRFGDGEKLAIEKNPCGGDGWAANRTQVKNDELAKAMYNSLIYIHKDYYIGISCPCCDLRSNKFYIRNVKLDKSHITYANIFSNANILIAENFIRELLLSGKVDVVGCEEEATIKIPKNVVEPLVDPTLYLEQIANSTKNIILLAAGPYSCILIYEYLLRNMPSKTIIDIGSVFDGACGRKTRKLHEADHMNRRKVCKNLLRRF